MQRGIDGSVLRVSNTCTIAVNQVEVDRESRNIPFNTFTWIPMNCDVRNKRFHRIKKKTQNISLDNFSTREATFFQDRKT